MSTANFDRYNLVNGDNKDNVREDVSDIISNISPTQTPFLSAAGTGKASATYTEWPKDSLLDVNDANALIDGADAGADVSTPVERVGNWCQISGKVARISGRAEAVDKIGRASEMAYQMAKRGKELKRDMEAILTGKQASVVGDSSTASKLGGLRNWYETNTNIAGDGANTGWAAGGLVAATDGTIRALTETALRGVIQSIYSEGGEADTIMVTPPMKTVISEYLFTSSARIATLYRDAPGQAPGTAVGAVDVFVSDFGALKIIPNRFQGMVSGTPRHKDVHVLDMSLIEVRYLRKFFTSPLARTGDADNRQMLVDYTLCVKNEAGIGLVGDINHAVAMTAS